MSIQEQREAQFFKWTQEVLKTVELARDGSRPSWEPQAQIMSLFQTIRSQALTDAIEAVDDALQGAYFREQASQSPHHSGLCEALTLAGNAIRDMRQDYGSKQRVEHGREF